jgi:hypothetical protein
MTFVTIGNRVSPSSSVNGNPLDDFPDHWQPRFSPSFPFAGQVKGRTGPFERKICPLSAARESRSVKPWGLLFRSCHLRHKMFTHRRALIRRATNGLSCARFCCSRDRFVAQLFFGSNPVLDIFSVFAAAFKIQLMSPASDLFSRWFSPSKHGNLLGCQYGAGAPTDLRI